MRVVRDIVGCLSVRHPLIGLRKSSISILLSICALLVVGSHLASLTIYPRVFIDEPWFANVSWNLLNTGKAVDTIHKGGLVAPESDGVLWPNIGLLASIPGAAVFSVLGLGLFQARFVSWVFGFLLLVVLVFAARQSYSLVTGLLSIVLLSLSEPFVQASHYVRPDIVLSVVVVTVYLVAIYAFQEERWWAHAGVGLVLGMSLDVHPNAVPFIPAMMCLYVLSYGKTVLRKVGSWLFAGGIGIGVAYYVGVHILPKPNEFFDILSLSLGGTHQLPSEKLSPFAFLASVRREIGRYHFYDNNLEFALVGASIVYLIVRHSEADRRLLAFVGTAFAGFVLFVGNKHDVYAILFYPFFMLMVAETLVTIIRAGNALEPQRVFSVALLALLLVNSGLHYIRPLAQNRGYDYYAITDRIEEVIPEGARVMGLPHWWFGLAEYDYRSSLNLTYYHFYNDYTLTEGLEADRPDILIVDSGLRGLLVEEGGFPPGPGFEIYKLPRQPFERFLTERGELLLEFRDRWHGTFEIYEIDWE